MSTPPRFSERKPARAADPVPDASAASPAAKLPSLSQRLPAMSDYQLTAYQASANRIGADPQHPKCNSARKAIPLIEAEIRRRADTLAAAASKAKE